MFDLHLPLLAQQQLKRAAEKIMAQCDHILTNIANGLNQDQIEDITTIQEYAHRMLLVIPLTIDNIGQSHDLRTSLGAVIGFSELLYSESEGALTSDQKACIQGIREQGRYYLRNVNSILDYWKYQNNLLQVNITQTSYAELPEFITGYPYPKTSVQSNAFEFAADEFWLGLSIQEIIRNVEQHTPNFSPELHITQHTNELQIAITDHGNGIPPEHLDHIFKPFWRYPDTLETFGMGLAVVKAVMELHGGTVTVQSVVGKGSTFTLHLPHTSKLSH
ncbi:MAG: HAMP domain-containing sensor histidine kinase [Chloroflexota bacterium]